ncbi:MAG TPA: NAD-dependent dehydratase [Porphyromonadaceae bacterium]|nr:NAD-dependent dehydratase [Porphyromonadaceae bacterium]
MEKPKILITGAGGFIGSFLVQEAIERGFEVWAGVRSTTKKDYLQWEGLHFIDLDFSHKEHLFKQIEECKEDFGGWDYIIHNLGKTKESYEGEFMEVNYVFLRNFVEVLQETNVQPKQFVYMSSLSSYGLEKENGKRPIEESQKQNPYSKYGKSKLLSEQFLQSQKNFPYTILCPTGVYGPREKDYFLMIKCIQWGMDIRIGLKEQQLTFIYVKDLVRAIFLSIEHHAVQKRYIIAEDRAYCRKDFKGYVMQILHKKWVVPIIIPLPIFYAICLIAEFFGKLGGHLCTLNRDKYKIIAQRNWRCDTQRAKEELNFSARYSLEEGLKETIVWYREKGWL